LQLTGLGQSVVSALNAHSEIFATERELLASLPTSLSQAVLHRALAHRGTS
jgi:hypothetical protein